MPVAILNQAHMVRLAAKILSGRSLYQILDEQETRQKTGFSSENEDLIFS